MGAVHHPLGSRALHPVLSQQFSLRWSQGFTQRVPTRQPVRFGTQKPATRGTLWVKPPFRAYDRSY
jgi:hypothetical protein